MHPGVTDTWCHSHRIAHVVINCCENASMELSHELLWLGSWSKASSQVILLNAWAKTSLKTMALDNMNPEQD